MDSELNPYTPGSGRRPPALTGRDATIKGFDLVVARSKRGVVDRGVMLSGLRGVGKTALLNHLRMHVAEPRDWVTISLEAQTTASGAAAVRRQLGRELLTAVRRFSHRRRLEHVLESLQGVIGTFTLSIGPVSVSRQALPAGTERAGSGALEVDLPELVEDVCTVLQREGSALALFIDELQDLDLELLSALLTVQHMTQQRELPFYLVGAGLPNLPATLTSARSYAERLFTYTTIGPLSTRDAGLALSEPAEQLGAGFASDALTLLVEVSGGYPYFLQTFGQAIWDLAPEKTFTLPDAHAAILEGWEALDGGFFPSRWERATPAERAYLHAMATLAGTGGGAPTTAAVVKQLDTSQKASSATRSQLIGKGLIYSPEHGRVAFTVPGMVDFLQRQDPTIDRSR